MSFTGRLMRQGVVPVLSALLGRRNLVRLARLLTMESRLDVANDMQSNGELLVQRIVLENLPSGRSANIFDVGANRGEWTAALLQSAEDKEVRVHAFEPASVTYKLLIERVTSFDDRVVPVKMALSNQAGSATLFIVGAGLGVNSLHAPAEPAASTEQVELITLDRYCAENKVTHLELVKIDAEGHDLAVLEGSRAMLAAHAISVIQFEYNQRWIESRHYLKDVFDLLLPMGYKIGKVTPKGIEFYPGWHFELESFREGNYIACLEEWVARFPRVTWWNLE